MGFKKLERTTAQDTTLSQRQKSFVTFGLGSSLQILVANWKKYPCQFHWQRGFLALAMAVRLGWVW